MGWEGGSPDLGPDCTPWSLFQQWVGRVTAVWKRPSHLANERPVTWPLSTASCWDCLAQSTWSLPGRAWDESRPAAVSCPQSHIPPCGGGQWLRILLGQACPLPTPTG